MRDLLLCAKHLFVAAMVAWQRLKDEPVDTLDLREVRLSVPKAGLNYASFRRRCSACRVDSCRNVYSVGQSTMNWRRGLFRLWIVGSALFVIAVAFICYNDIKAHAEVPWATLEMCATIAFGISASGTNPRMGLLRVRCQTAMKELK